MKPARNRCVVCGSTAIEALVWIHVRGLPHDDPGHNVIYDYSGIAACNTCGHSQLEKFSHDCWSHDEDWDMYWWFALDPHDTQRLRQLLATCPNPLDPSCACALHAGLKTSGETVYAGINHVCMPQSKTRYARLLLAANGNIPILKVDGTHPPEETA